MIESERSRWWRPRSLNKLVMEDELMDRSVVLTLNKYMLLSVTPERPATSMAIKLATVRMNGRATQNILPMLPILGFSLSLRMSLRKSVVVYLVVVDVWYDVDAIGWSGYRTRFLNVGPFPVDVWERKHQRLNTKPIEIYINEVESEGMREKEDRCKT